MVGVFQTVTNRHYRAWKDACLFIQDRPGADFVTRSYYSIFFDLFSVLLSQSRPRYHLKVFPGAWKACPELVEGLAERVDVSPLGSLFE